MHTVSRTLLTFFVLLAVLPAFAQTGGDLNLECLLQPSRVVNIGTPVPGVLASVLVERGDVVRKGAALARLDSRAQKAAVELSRARSEYAVRRVERNEELYREDLVSNQERDELITERQLADLELKERLVQLERRTITSPFLWATNMWREPQLWAQLVTTVSRSSSRG